jgi:O-antigen ligase
LAALALLLLVLPTQFQDRLLDSFDLRDTTTQSRLELLRTGAAMVADHPLTGVGPQMVPVTAPRYRSNPEFPGWLYQHLHNTPLQIAAEIGLIGLAAWLVLWGVLLRDFLRMTRASRDGPRLTHFAAANAVCVSVAFLAAGLLEYNFGDSELLNLMVFFVIAPYVLHHRQATSA